MAYLKPQSPLKKGNDYLYPLTTYDQIVMPDGSRWNGVVNEATAVGSVNGKTGTVTLTASDVGALPDTYTPPVDGISGIYSDSSGSYPYTDFKATNGNAVVRAYEDGSAEIWSQDGDYISSLNNDATYPAVTSINGMTGDVSLSSLTLRMDQASNTPVDEYYDITVPGNSITLYFNLLGPLTSGSTLPSGNDDGCRVVEVGNNTKYPLFYIHPANSSLGLIFGNYNGETEGSFLYKNVGSSSISLANAVNVWIVNPHNYSMTFRIYNWY